MNPNNSMRNPLTQEKRQGGSKWVLPTAEVVESSFRLGSPSPKQRLYESRAPVPSRPSTPFGISAAHFRVSVGSVLLILLGACSGREGTLVTCTIQGPSLSHNQMGVSDQQHIAVYLPPAYYDDTSRRFPVLYLLPNFNACLWRYTGGSFQGFHLKEA